jgi:MTH538 TIR-like domain (DUF1863)
MSGSDTASRRYAAFISCPYQDRALARWLQRSLERYVVPKTFRQLLPDPKKRKISPVCRDEDEFAASSDLGASIRAALDRSNALIVLCSRNSAASLWVDEEVKYFSANRGTAPIIAVLIGSEANESAKHPPPPFPPSLAHGSIIPLAADFRPGAESKRKALTRIAAGILGCEFEAFERRRRRETFRRRTAIFGPIVLALLLFTTALGWVIQSTRSEEERSKLRRAIEDSACSNVNFIGSEAKRLEMLLQNENERSHARQLRGSAARIFEACVALYTSGHTDFADDPQFVGTPDWASDCHLAPYGGRLISCSEDRGEPLGP